MVRGVGSVSRILNRPFPRAFRGRCSRLGPADAGSRSAARPGETHGCDDSSSATRTGPRSAPCFSDSRAAANGTTTARRLDVCAESSGKARRARPARADRPAASLRSVAFEGSARAPRSLRRHRRLVSRLVRGDAQYSLEFQMGESGNCAACQVNEFARCTRLLQRKLADGRSR